MRSGPHYEAVQVFQKSNSFLNSFNLTTKKPRSEAFFIKSVFESGLVVPLYNLSASSLTGSKESGQNLPEAKRPVMGLHSESN